MAIEGGKDCKRGIERKRRGRHFAKTIKSKGNFFQHHVRKFCDGIVIFKVIKKPLLKRLSQVIRKVVIQTLFEKPSREECALKKWRLLDEDIMQDCPSENVPSRNILFLKTGKSFAIDYSSVWFYFYHYCSQSIETSQKNNEKFKYFISRAAYQFWIRIIMVYNVCVWKFEMGRLSERVCPYVTSCLFF